MAKKKIFDNAKVTRLMSEYSKDTKDLRLRDRILKLTMPLISAAISRKRYYRNRDDLTQECVVKLIYALPKFNPSRGNAFAFLWTTICNTCNTQDQRLASKGLSMSSDEDAMREAEVNGNEVFQTPENVQILREITSSIQTAFNEIEMVGSKKSHTLMLHKVKASIMNGELFYNREKVMHDLKKTGLPKKEVKFLLDRTIVMVRQKLLDAKENASAISVRETNIPFSKNSYTTVL